jgi:uncharacterized protein (DUF1684 family)
MRQRLYVLFSLLLIFSACSRSEAPSHPVKLGKTEAEKVIEQIEKQRVEEEKWLRDSPTSYFAAIARIDFDRGTTLTVGRAADNDVRLDDAVIQPHHLRVTVEGDRFRVECIDANAHFLVKEELKRDAIVGPSYIQVGRFRLRLSHQRFPALIVFDPNNPKREHNKKINYFPIDLSYRYELPLKRHPKPEKTIILSTRGNRRSAERIGWVDFLVGDTPCRLYAVHLLEPGSGEDDLSIFFRDASTGKETYALGRYVDLKKLGSGLYLLDFNLAYNPACAFSEYYNCPVPPKENVLKVAIRAGEKAPILAPIPPGEVNPELLRGRAAVQPGK